MFRFLYIPYIILVRRAPNEPVEKNSDYQRVNRLFRSRKTRNSSCVSIPLRRHVNMTPLPAGIVDAALCGKGFGPNDSSRTIRHINRHRRRVAKA